MRARLPYTCYTRDEGYVAARAMAFDPENGLCFIVDMAAEDRSRAREHLCMVMDSLGYGRFELVAVDDVDSENPAHWEPDPSQMPTPGH